VGQLCCKRGFFTQLSGVGTKHVSFEVFMLSFVSWKAHHTFLIWLEFVLLLYIQINKRENIRTNFLRRSDGRGGVVVVLLDFKVCW